MKILPAARSGIITFFENSVTPDQEGQSSILTNEVTWSWDDKDNVYIINGEMFGEEMRLALRFNFEQSQFENEKNDKVAMSLDQYRLAKELFFLGLANLYQGKMGRTRRFKVYIHLQQE